ncbi:MAG: tRNA (N6-threonylcarbamoyladenosine(37)-N6)-methyltransferase TrmO [Firmicutes bacterium]|nr:tRNA (N6-threonylcarbamoyladenosine(37)-N6)-methyltransferase TrmO [Bacillota bacterium]
MKEIRLRPIGTVKAGTGDIYAMSKEGESAVVEVKEEYVPALQRIQENSHLWIICWFDKADRSVLQTMPRIMEPEPVDFGVFALRCFSRPNPIAITLVSLEKVEGNRVYVAGLDAIEGTPVLDIKPYFEQDSIFSPRTSYVKPKDEEVRRGLMHKLAYRHHKAETAALELGLRICLEAETHFGHLFDLELFVTVKGSRELADVIQGITRARLANPPRFTFVEADKDEVIFTKKGKKLTFTVKKRYSLDALQGLADNEIFSLT